MGYELYTVIADILRIYSYLMIAWIILSYIPNARYSPFGVWLGRIVEPYFSFFRRFIPPIGMVDISSIIAFFVYRILVQIVLGLIAPLVINL